MDEQSAAQMLREGKITAEDLLRETAAEKVDGITEMLLRYLPRDEVCRALYERISGAPLADFDTLRTAYFIHFERVPSITSASKQSVLSYLAAASAPPGGARINPRPARELVRLGGGAHAAEPKDRR